MDIDIDLRYFEISIDWLFSGYQISLSRDSDVFVSSGRIRQHAMLVVHSSYLVSQLIRFQHGRLVVNS